MKKERLDAVRITGLDGFHAVALYVMPKRTEAEVSSTETFDITDLCAFMEKRNRELGTNLKLFHAFCTAVARTIYLRPKMNVFISGRRYWQRKDITLSFVAKRKFEDSAEEVLILMKVEPEMTVEHVSSLILGDVSDVRQNKTNDVGSTMDFLAKMPRFAMEIIFAVVRMLEYFGVMPASLMKGDPNYSTALLSNLGSIGAGAPYHHLSNYGTCSIMITIGTMRKEMRKMEDGSMQERTLLDATFTIDERIADGFYFAKSLRITRYLLEHPEHLLETMEMPVPVSLS